MIKKIAAAAFLASLAASTFAATPGIYAGVDGGSTKIDNLSGHETSYGAVLGYTINPTWAVEAGFRRLGTWTVNSVDVKADQVALSAIGTIPLSNGFSAYGRLGVNNLDASAHVSNVTVSDNTTKLLYGAGVAYDFGDNVGARLEVQKPSSDSTNVSFGVTYSFK
jgi:OOP family OmpA-OmpF porin